MRILSDSAGFISSSQTPSQDRDFAVSFTGQEAYQEIIKKAESVSIIKICKNYGINIDEYNRKSTCPFFKHKGGKESTASFYIYPETNTFWCFGCKTGSTAVDLVANLERCNKIQASFKLLNKFNDDVDPLFLDKKYKDSYQEKTNLLFSFSKKIREKMELNPELQFKIENLCSSFDKMNEKYDLDLDAVKALIEKINIRIDNIK